jgi:hypothetical protein
MKATLIAVNMILALFSLVIVGLMISQRMPGWPLLFSAAVVLIGMTVRLRKERI